MSGIPNISGSTSQTSSSGASGGALDTQGRYTFGGINTTGVGGASSADSTHSYVAIAIIAVAILAGIYLVTRR